MWSSKDAEVCFLDLRLVPRVDKCHVVQIGACFGQKKFLPLSFFAIPPEPLSEHEMRFVKKLGVWLKRSRFRSGFESRQLRVDLFELTVDTCR
jgi:hypothetical protein